MGLLLLLLLLQQCGEEAAAEAAALAAAAASGSNVTVAAPLNSDTKACMCAHALALRHRSCQRQASCLGQTQHSIRRCFALHNQRTTISFS